YTTFLNTNGLSTVVPDNVRYVITLDADTRLPRDTVRRLIGKMAHPLNTPRFDASQGCVVEGYAVLQPRVTPSLPVAREGSRFQRIFSSMNGIDPYGSAISDVYQDLFAQGSYAGKGIYDVDAFEAALAAILSLMIGWVLPLEAAAVWTAFILGTIALPTLIPVLSAIVPARPGIVVRSHLMALGAELRLAFAQSGLLFVLLAHQAWS